MGKYSNDIHSISFGITNIAFKYDQYESENLKPFFNYDFKFKSDFTINISSDIVPYNRIENIFTHISRFYERSSISVNFENQNQKHTLSYTLVNDDERFDIISCSSYIYKDWFKGF